MHFRIGNVPKGQILVITFHLCVSVILCTLGSSGSSGRVRGGEKHEIYAAAFGGHLFYDLFLQGRGAPRPPWIHYCWGRGGCRALTLPSPDMAKLVPTRTGKMGRRFPVREKSGNFEQTGKVRENHTKYWKIEGISEKNICYFSMIFKWTVYYLLKCIKFLVRKNETLKNTGKWKKNTGKVREFCQPVKVGTLMKHGLLQSVRFAFNWNAFLLIYAHRLKNKAKKKRKKKQKAKKAKKCLRVVLHEKQRDLYAVAILFYSSHSE